MSEPFHTLGVTEKLTLADVVRASRGELTLTMSHDEQDRLSTARKRVIQHLIESGQRLYGFNTGFGDNRTRPTVPTSHLGIIQDNLILSHASGYGESLAPEVVRAAILIRVHTLAIGHSGVRNELVKELCGLFNSRRVPKIPKFGSVGASGDLAPLSHMALALMGKADFLFDPKEDADQFFEESHLTYRPSDEFPGVEGPTSTFGPKEGLALNNGTSFMAAHLALAVDQFENLLWHADLAVALNLEAMCGVTDAFKAEVQALRPHKGIQFSAARVLENLAGSELVFSNGLADEFATSVRTKDGIVDNVQDDYCLRCAPVVHGTALQSLWNAQETVVTEINSVTDNPLVFDSEVLSGAHFHGMPLSLAADQLRTAMAIVGGVSERRIAKLMNDKRNYGIPRHLVLDDPHGVKSGWMIAQYTAASMVNELKTRSMPYCVGNVTTGNESEDFVSMGANACRAAYEMVEVLCGIVAIELAAAVRALLIRIDTSRKPGDVSGGERRLSSSAQNVIAAFAEHGIEVSHRDDRPLNEIFESTSNLIKSQSLNP